MVFLEKDGFGFGCGTWCRVGGVESGGGDCRSQHGGSD